MCSFTAELLAIVLLPKHSPLQSIRSSGQHRPLKSSAKSLLLVHPPAQEGALNSTGWVLLSQGRERHWRLMWQYPGIVGSTERHWLGSDDVAVTKVLLLATEVAWDVILSARLSTGMDVNAILSFDLGLQAGRILWTPNVRLYCIMLWITHTRELRRDGSWETVQGMVVRMSVSDGRLVKGTVGLTVVLVVRLGDRVTKSWVGERVVKAVGWFDEGEFGEFGEEDRVEGVDCIKLRILIVKARKSSYFWVSQYDDIWIERYKRYIAYVVLEYIKSKRCLKSWQLSGCTTASGLANEYRIFETISTAKQ
jgi:hypothetical protein